MRETYRIEDGEIIVGQTLPVFIYNLHYHLTEIKIFKDGKIDCWELVDFDTFIHKVKTGWIQTSVPDGETIFAFPLGNFTIDKFYPRRTTEELIKEVKDIVEVLNDRPTTSAYCAQAFKNYQDNPTTENKEKLNALYEDVPAHNRQFILGDMDVDDIPIRVILYGETEYDKTHKGQVQKQYIIDYYLKGIKQL